MSEINLNISLADYTDNVRIITTKPLRQHYGDGVWEVIENPATPLEDLENALKILEKIGRDKTKREKIKKEIERRKNTQKEKVRWWHPFRSEKEGRDFVRRWNEVTRMIKGGRQHG